MLVDIARSRPIVEECSSFCPQYIGTSIRIHMQNQWVNFQTTEKALHAAAWNRHEAVARLLMVRRCGRLGRRQARTDAAAWRGTARARDSGSADHGRGADIPAAEHRSAATCRARERDRGGGPATRGRGADISAAEKDGQTPLRDATRNRHEAAVRCSVM